MSFVSSTSDCGSSAVTAISCVVLWHIVPLYTCNGTALHQFVMHKDGISKRHQINDYCKTVLVLKQLRYQSLAASHWDDTERQPCWIPFFNWNDLLYWRNFELGINVRHQRNFINKMISHGWGAPMKTQSNVLNLSWPLMICVNWVNIIPADALAPAVATSSAAMILILSSLRVNFINYIAFQYCGLKQNADTYLCFLKTVQGPL